MTNLIETRGLCRTFGSEETKVTALDHVSINIEEGEFTAIIGPSGSGKTTLLHLIGGLDEPNGGSVTLSGSNIANMSGNQLSDFRRDHIGFIFQAYNLIPVLSAEENIEYIMLLQGVGAAERKKRVKEMLAMVELEGLGDRRPSHLSGGQQQRLCIARAVATEPEVLLMDEPCSALDPIATAQIEQLIDELRSSYSVVIVTHSMAQASRVSDRTAFFHLGELVEYGDTSHIFTNPSDKRTESYITGRIG